MIGDKYFWAGKFHLLLADDANTTPCKRKKNLQCGGGVAPSCALVFVEKHDGPRGNNPRDEKKAEIDTPNDFPSAADRCGNALPCRAGCAGGSQSRNLQPRRGFSRGYRSGKMELLCFFATEFSAGSFGNAAWRN